MLRKRTDGTDGTITFSEFLVVFKTTVFSGIHLDQRKRQISLALLFTELLKFALRKNFYVKSAKSKLSCNRTVI